MKKIIVVWVIFIVLMLSYCSTGKNQKQQTEEKKPLLVKVEAVKQGLLSKELNYKGTVTAWKTANIIPETSGRIGRIYRKPGDKVAKGDILAELDLTSLELQQKQSKAAVAVAQSAYNDASLTCERMKKMFENRAISQIQLEKAQLALDAADTQLKSAMANLELVDYMLKNSSMRAPFDCVVVSKNMEEGDMINPQMGMNSSVMTVMDLTKVKAAVDVSAEEIEKIRIGQACRVMIASLPGESFLGEVYSKNLAADPLSKTFKVEVKIDNPNIKIKAGVYADIAIEYIRKENVYLLPLSSLLAGDKEVMVNENGVARKRAVTVGERNHTRFEVLSGVNPNDQVLIEGNYDLKDGTAIVVTGEK